MQTVADWKKTRSSPQQSVGSTTTPAMTMLPPKKFSLGSFLKETGKEILRLPVRASANIATAGLETAKFLGSKEAEQKLQNIKAGGYQVPGLGSIRPIGDTGKGFVSDLKDTLGAGLEAASYIPIARLPSLGAQALKSSIPTAAKSLAKEGIIAGGVGGVGHELQNPEATFGSTLKSGAIGAGAGGVLGGVLGAAAPIAGKVLSRAKPLSVAEWKSAGKPVEAPVAPGVVPQATRPKKTMEEFSKSQGYEPITPTEKLPVIEMGTRPKPPKSDLPVISMEGASGGTKKGKGVVDDVQFVPEPMQRELPRQESLQSQVSPIQVVKQVETPKVAPAKPVQTKSNTQLKSRVFERIQAENPALEGDLNYNPVKLKEDAAKAVDLIEKDKQRAFNIAMGKEASDDVTSTAVNIAMAEKALDEGNISLYSRLIKNRSIEQTRRGQEIVAEKGSVTDNSTSRYVKELIAMRLDKLGGKYLADIRDLGKKTGAKQRGTNRIEKEVKNLQKDIKAKKITMTDARELLDALACV